MGNTPRVVVNLSGDPFAGKSRAMKAFLKRMKQNHSSVSICTIGTGDEVRRAKESGGLSTVEVDQVTRGCFLSDTKTYSLIEKAVVRESAFSKDGIVFDGYPRQESQVPDFMALIKNNSRGKHSGIVRVMIKLVIPDQTVIWERFEVRKKTENRSDDTEETLRARLVKTAEVQPFLEERWKREGGQIIPINASGSVEEVDTFFWNEVSHLFV